jgi:hypothetical protein
MIANTPSEEATMPALIVSDSGGGGNFTPPPAGTHLARCVQIIQLGTLYSPFYESWKPKVLIGWELPDEPNDTDDGKPFLTWNRYTASLHENAKLRAHLEAWRGRQFTEEELKRFDLNAILDKPCFLNIGHRQDKGKTYADITAVMALRKGTPVPDRVHDLIVFSVTEPDLTVFEKFGDNLKKTIRSCKEAEEPSHPLYQQNGQNGAAQSRAFVPDDANIVDSDIPF